jgi:hypothetical protein
MTVEIRTKAIVSVAEMARMVGLSRARFYQLVKTGVFPAPLYHISTKRPFFTEEMQAVCVEVRHRNCGINGTPVLFYARRIGPVMLKTTAKRTPARDNSQITELVEGVRCLGLTTVNAPQVERVVREMYPNGVNGIDQGTVLRAIFLRLMRQNSTDNVG